MECWEATVAEKRPSYPSMRAKLLTSFRTCLGISSLQPRLPDKLRCYLEDGDGRLMRRVLQMHNVYV